MKNQPDKKRTGAFDLPQNSSEYTFIDLSGRPDNKDWQAFIKQRLAKAVRFEIHCWKEENRRISLAEKYGQRADTGWDWGVVIQGEVTADFAVMLLSQPQPDDRQIYNKMTPFFTIRFDSGYESGHWGTENYAPAEKS